MKTLRDGVAHVSFVGGGTFLPAWTPYDRQILVEHVANRVRASGRVQVLIDGHRWMVHRHGGRVAYCAHCNAPTDTASCSMVGDDTAYCLRCALDERLEPVPPLALGQRGTAG